MRKLSLLTLILAFALPVVIPLAPALAQESTAVEARLEEYNANLPAGYGIISATDLSVEMIDNPDLLVVDVREADEYAEGHIPDAINSPLRELAQHLDLLPDLDAPIVVYCGSGFRSAIGMTALQILGYTDVRNMAGGIAAWNAEEFGTDTEPVEAMMGTAPEIDPDVLAAVDAGLMAIPQGWGAVTAVDLNVELIENPPDLLIDVRRPEEWAEGYIEGAVHMPLESFMSFAGDWPEAKDATIVVYCKSGHRGNMAATMLRTLGYTDVRNLAVGITAWITEGLPTVTD
jgi:rhodanese-related sulfurtransferase